MPDGSIVNLRAELHPKQLELRDSLATEILYGGAAGGGKSHALRILAILWAWAFPGLQVYLFRRISEDLNKNHMEGRSGFRMLLAPWVQAGLVEIIETEIRFKFNGSRIYLCHCHEEKDRYKYQGAEIDVLLIDELTHFTEVIYRFLRSRMRTVGLVIPPELESLKDRFPRIVCGSNPGNVGHQWVKRAFIDGHQPDEVWQTPDDEGGMLRQFIPARLYDNPSLDALKYRTKLRGLGSAALVKAMEEGDWNAIEGAFFDCFLTSHHVVKPFAVPKDWTKFRAFDWGSASPFSVGWWAVVTEAYTTEEGITLPRGCLVNYREWYGGNGNTGLKLKNPQIAQGILIREAEEIAYSVADPSIFKQDGGPSIAEEFHNHGVTFRKADNTRIPGWQQVRKRMIGDDDGNPMIVWFETCVDSIRTIPALMHDDVKPEDVDTDGEDHAADQCRYACMSRPWAMVKEESKKFPAFVMPTLGQLTEMHMHEISGQGGRI